MPFLFFNNPLGLVFSVAIVFSHLGATSLPHPISVMWNLLPFVFLYISLGQMLRGFFLEYTGIYSIFANTTKIYWQHCLRQKRVMQIELFLHCL